MSLVAKEIAVWTSICRYELLWGFTFRRLASFKMFCCFWYCRFLWIFKLCFLLSFDFWHHWSTWRNINLNGSLWLKFLLVDLFYVFFLTLSNDWLNNFSTLLEFHRLLDNTLILKLDFEYLLEYLMHDLVVFSYFIQLLRLLLQLKIHLEVFETFLPQERLVLRL